MCTYDDEMTNFAHWYVYYKSRLQMMKTSVGLAFAYALGARVMRRSMWRGSRSGSVVPPIAMWRAR